MKEKRRDKMKKKKREDEREKVKEKMKRDRGEKRLLFKKCLRTLKSAR